MAILKASAHGKIVSHHCCKSKVSLTCLTRSHVNPEGEEMVETMQSDFWRNVVKSWQDMDKRILMQDTQREYDMATKQSFFNNAQM